MTQAEAVKRLVEWLPTVAYTDFIDGPPDTAKFKTVHDVWQACRIFYSAPSWLSRKGKAALYHFTQFACDTASFQKRKCLCVKVDSCNRVVWVREHLPFKGKCHD